MIDIFAQLAVIQRLWFKSKHLARSPQVFRSKECAKANIGANVIHHITWPKVALNPLQCFWFLPGVTPRSILFDLAFSIYQDQVPFYMAVLHTQNVCDVFTRYKRSMSLNKV